MGMLEKFPPMGYVTPGSWRRLVAKNGSGRVLSLTSAATTVVGTVAMCHPLGTNVGLEMVSPLASTLAEVCRNQWSRRASLAAGAAGLEAWGSAARSRCEPR